MATDTTTEPVHLAPETLDWWRIVRSLYQFEPHHLKLLTLAAEAWDRAQEARERIAEDGAYLMDRFGQLRSHPAVAVERDSRVAFSRMLRELNLDGAPEPDVRVPRVGGRR